MGMDRRGAMSLFEDNAEYAYGFLLGHQAIQKEVVDKVERLDELNLLGEQAAYYLKEYDRSETSKAASDALLTELDQYAPKNEEETEIKDFII